MNFADIILGLVIMLALAVMIVPAIIDLVIGIKCFDLIVQYRYLGGSCWGMKDCGNDIVTTVEKQYKERRQRTAQRKGIYVRSV